MALQSSDPIADMLTRIRNAIMAGHATVRVPASKQKEVIARQLVKAGYLAGVDTEKGTPANILVITIHEDGASPVITELQRVSRPGRRVYAGADEIPRVKNGRGVIFVSTSKGVMTGAEARKARLGGELICSVY